MVFKGQFGLCQNKDAFGKAALICSVCIQMMKITNKLNFNKGLDDEIAV